MPAIPLLLRKSADPPTLDARQQLDATIDTTARRDAHPAEQLLEAPSNLVARQSSGVLAIPTQYQGLNAGPAPGAVAGIVLGSIAGFLFLLWLLWILSNGSGFIRSTDLIEEDVIVRRRSRSRGTRKSRHTEMASRSPRRERVIRQERIIRSSVPPPRESSRFRETILVDEESRGGPERRVEGDDIVEVIEEHSSVGIPPPRRKNRKSSGGYR